MPAIELVELASFRDFVALSAVRVQPAQRGFTKHWLLTYLQSRHPAVSTYSVQVAGDLVGFVMLIHAENPTQWIIERLTIDRDHQRQGVGYGVADRLIDMIHCFENRDMVISRYDPKNEAARALFARLNFVEREEMFRGRKIALLEFEFEEAGDAESDDADDSDDEIAAADTDDDDDERG
ncbi:MAG: GNAT family N-acetyltransferase [Chloroflexi bacterium]|nr:GNAT family N-acetyltransferase [Chloroflexota bacterium]